IEWSENGVEGCYRFIGRVYRLVYPNIDYLKTPYNEPQFEGDVAKTIMRATHAAIKKVTADIERFQLNTAVAAIMEMVNALYLAADKLETENDKAAFSASLKALLKLIAPFTPHVAEELWEMTAAEGFISNQEWPTFNESYTISDEITLVVQINGKVRAEMKFPRNVSQEIAMEAAFANEKVKNYIDGKDIIKKIFVPNKLISIVVK
ncbi:MAG: class I tRNA ligase family protein, partial [Deferribacterales bacterium]|nr:class I tRNA ligase family protein [Deferribacterales bacterium]